MQTILRAPPGSISAKAQANSGHRNGAAMGSVFGGLMVGFCGGFWEVFGAGRKRLKMPMGNGKGNFCPEILKQDR